MRILTRTQYDAICDIVMEQKKRIEELEADLEKRKAQVKKLEDSIEYVNDKLFERTKEVSRLRQKLNENGLTWTVTGVDFPATTKQPENKYY